MRHRGVASLLAGSAALLLAACSGGQSGELLGNEPALESHDKVSGVVEPASFAPIAFEQCSLTTGESDGRAECATVDVPLDWNKTRGAHASFFVKRLKGTAEGPHKQLWLLQGGPGGAGDGLEPLADEIAKSDPAVDIYIPDHRGTGRSTFLDCTVQRKRLQFDYASCISEAKMKWGFEGLATFNTTTAAKDVGYVIEKTREDGQDVQVYGVSYGTYWAQRYLQLFPSQPTGVALDSVCQSGLCSFMKIGYWFDRVGKKYMSECAADPVCHEKLGDDPVDKVRQAIAKADAKTCAGLQVIDGESLRTIYGWLIASFELRVLIPATTFRILRCDADDVSALRAFEASMVKNAGPRGFTNEVQGARFGGTDGAPSLSSEFLGYHIAFSELEETPVIPREELADLLKDAVFTKPDAGIRDLYDAWPRYARDEHVGQYPQSTVPVLLMNGTLDPQTPQEFAEVIAPHYTGAMQKLVLLPRATHGVIHQSPIKQSTTSCGMTLWSQFRANPTQTVDASCSDDIMPFDFGGSTDIADYFFGRPNLWGPASAAPAKPVNPSPLYAKAPSITAELKRTIASTRPWLQPQTLHAK